LSPAAGPVAVYGATGYTGELVVRELQRRGIEHVLAGRNAHKLSELADRVGTDAHVHAVPADDVPGLRRLLEDCAAVVNCAGPFAPIGEHVVRAAVESGTHYVDTTGEQPYMQRVFERFGTQAEHAGVAVVPAIGFDYLPGDLLSNVAAQGLEPLRELVIAYAVSGITPSRGTMHSTLGIIRSRGIAYEDGDWRPAPQRPRRRAFRFPDPVGRQPMAPYPSGEIVTVPRHVRTRKVTSLISSMTFAPHPALAGSAPLTMPLLRAALHTPLRGALDAAITRLPEGPPEAERRAARFTIVALAHGEDGATGRGIIRGSDVYGLTGVMAVHAAALMADDGYDRGGVLAPAQAYDPVAFLDALVEHGLAWEVGATSRASVA
jgi:short subunit dehydrogenase-like uncharacterized protein